MRTEYQSMICALTGMDVSNASMYDGPTAAAEAMMMCTASVKKKNRVLLSRTLLPHVLKVVETYARFHGRDSFTINPGERIAQMVVARHETVEWEEVESLDDTARGEGGFGSTGK